MGTVTLTFELFGVVLGQIRLQMDEQPGDTILVHAKPTVAQKAVQAVSKVWMKGMVP